MLNGWFTIVAQAVNFLILVWLFKRFLYKPILHAIDARERGIAAQLATAQAKVAEGQKERDDFRARNEDFDHQRAALLTKATDEVKAERQRLIAGAHQDADALRAKRQDAVRSDQDHLNHEIVRWTQKQVFDIARRTLADLASPCLEVQMSEEFVIRLRALRGAARDQLTAALAGSPSTALVRSAIDLPPAQRSAIEAAVKEIFHAETQVHFETAPELVSGVELSANGQKVAWSIADYLARLEKDASELLQGEVKPSPPQNGKPKPGPQPASGARSEAKNEPRAEAKTAPRPELEPASPNSKGHP